jgi:transposase InsO family protein/transposase
MRLHRNAALSLKGRELLVDRVLCQSWLLEEAAQAAGVSERTAAKWLGRFRCEGPQGLLDRSSAPRTSPSRVPEERVQVMAALRRLRMTGAEIAECLGMPLSTVSGILARIGMGKLGRLGVEPAVRYERSRPGELIHIDVKKLGRIQGGYGKRVTGRGRRHNHRRVTDAAGQRHLQVGWEFVHVCIDDATRLAYVEVLGDERATTAIGFLKRAIAFYASHGVTVKQLLTDNGGAYVSTVHAVACRAMGIKHLRTRPYRPQTNGKAERFIRTMLAGWAYGAIYRDSSERTAALPGWLERYNWRRPHGALNHKPPGTRLAELNNVLGSYT